MSIVTGLTGCPLGHSISPYIHNTIAKDMKDNLTYLLFEVKKEELKDKIGELQESGVRGINVTIPYKRSVIELADYVSDEVNLFGAANTLKFLNDEIYAYNTDGYGFLKSLELQAGISPKGKDIAIFGTGGTARSIGAVCAMANAKSIIFVGRNEVAGEELCEELSKKFVVDVNFANGVIGEVDIVINTTPVGMSPNADACIIDDFDFFSGNEIVFDAIYNPAKTVFLQGVENRGCKILNGLGMLVFQAVKSYGIWMNREFDDEYILDLYNRVREGVVL